MTASCLACAAGVTVDEYCQGSPGTDGCPEVAPAVCDSQWVAPGKGCGGNCLNGNTPYNTLEEAWAQCEQVDGCGNILEWTNGNFYLRRDTDPDVADGSGRTLSHCPGFSAPPEFRSECGSDLPVPVSPGKGCPVGGSCLNDNTPYSTLEEAWAQCEQVSNCGNILMWTNGNYYLRRDTDPDVTTGLTMPFCLGLSSAPETRDACGADRAYQVGAVSPGKGCPSGNCLNDNTPYSTLEEAWAQCEQVTGCGNILEWTNGNYYLRRTTDPDVTDGSTIPFCLGLSSAPRDNAQAPAAVCPDGWEQRGEIGADIGGCGLQSCDQRYDIDSEGACAARCDETDACLGFSYAPMNGDRNHPGVTACTIYSSDTPTGTWTGTEGLPTQVFCSRPADEHTDAQPFPVPAVIRNAYSDRRMFAQSTSAGEGGVGAANGGELYADQKWIISAAGAGDGVYTITNEYSGRRLFAQDGSVGETGVGADNGETTWADQTWYFDEAEDGKYVIRNVYSDRRLFAQSNKVGEDGVGAADGGELYADQKWYIEAA